MARNKKLECVSYVILDGKPVEFRSLRSEKKEECLRLMTENIGRALSGYLSANPEEAKAIFSGRNAV